MEKPVFVLGSRKSGTSLLRSLLDGAEGLFVVPCETHFFQRTGKPFVLEVIACVSFTFGIHLNATYRNNAR